MTGRRWRRLQSGVAAFFVVAFGVALGVLAVRSAGESTRTANVVELRLAEDCAFFGDVASLPVPSTSTEFARRLVRNAARSYNARGCAVDNGPLTVDPDALLPAPSPAPSPTPSRFTGPL